MPTIHIFCSVIDNFGDLGVCWRLARQLAVEQGADVTLLVDDLAAFAQLDARVNPQLTSQVLGDITLMHWRSDLALALAPAAMVIEGFACQLPAHYRAQLTANTVWINLDYLSAEAWIDDCHGLSSPQPHGASTTFWFPGFSARSGGLLREAALLPRLANPACTQAFLQRHQLPPPTPGRPRIALFCYETDAVAALLSALHDTDAELMICASQALSAANAVLPSTLAIGERRRHGQCTLFALPMLHHDDFDTLLASCDLNIIRGEDSFVRAQWAAKPMLWHIYPQDDNAHEPKLAAWLARVTSAQANQPHPAVRQAWQDAQWAWVRNELMPEHIHALVAGLPALAAMMQGWRDQLAQAPDLATQLMRFYANQVESTPEKTHPDKPL